MFIYTLSSRWLNTIQFTTFRYTTNVKQRIEHELRCIMSRIKSLNSSKMLCFMHRIMHTQTHARKASRIILCAYYTFHCYCLCFIHSSIFRAPHDEARWKSRHLVETKDTSLHYFIRTNVTSYKNHIYYYCDYFAWHQQYMPHSLDFTSNREGNKNFTALTNAALFCRCSPLFAHYSFKCDESHARCRKMK